MVLIASESVIQEKEPVSSQSFGVQGKPRLCANDERKDELCLYSAFNGYVKFLISW